MDRLQLTLGRAHQIIHPLLAHLADGLFGGDAPVHYPYPPRLAVGLFDLLEEAQKRGLVAGVAGHHLVGQGQTLGRDHQGDDHLPAVRTAIPAVAVFGLGDLFAESLEVGAGQIIQQHIIRGVEQVLPLLMEMLK